jgi:diaminohydroxyphosphoribosylaminopyrimidine deaminase / 5-amino-6-(5-phosphoribosylamino)uracil reductase
MWEEEDIKFMTRCLDLARGAEGMTYPNPLVGSVIVCEGRIIGEGYHIRAGEAHAEENAINSVSDKRKLRESTLYVSLEPCSHFGKRPPCADLIISSGIRKVVAGTRDTSSKVSGKGFDKLRQAGVAVVEGVLADECRYLNRRFFTYNEKRRPYIILKWAQSADGFISPPVEAKTERKPTWIIGKAERAMVHRWRASEQSILVGAGTLRSDNPELNVRDWTGSNPVRIVLSGSGNLEGLIPLFRTNGTNIVFTYSEACKLSDSEVVLMKKGVNASEFIAQDLFHRGKQSLIVEGGAEVLNHFIETGLWDEARIFTGKMDFGSGVMTPSIQGQVISSAGFSASSLRVLNNGSRC